MKIINGPYGTNPELDKLVNSNNQQDRYRAVEQGYGLDILINDKDEDVRAEVAEAENALELRESSHDVPTGSQTYIIGISTEEYNKLSEAEFEEVVKFAE